VGAFATAGEVVQPYRLAERSKLTPEPPFNAELVRKMLAEAMRGPKGRAAQIDEATINKLTNTLNARHALFVAAQGDRGRAARRARVVKLFAELRAALPEIIKDIEQQATDFFGRHNLIAARALHRAIGSDVVEKVLPPVALSDSIASWKWTGKTLYEDVAALIGSNAAVRFLSVAIPLVSGEHPKAGAIAVWIKQQRKAAA
jgi:hypothetical protein